MTWRIGIRHVTGYEYEQPVSSSYNEARITPISSDRQVTLEAAVEVLPSAAVYRYWDWWGTLVHSFDLHEPHDELVITGTSVVETSAVPDPPAAPATWAELSAWSVRDHFSELLSTSRYVPLADGILDAASELDGALDPLATCSAVLAWVRERLRYERGTTTVSTTAADTIEIGSGVCQDFTHVALGQAEECLAELQPGAGRAGFDDEARRILGRARTELEFRRVHELIADLPAYLRSLQSACSDAGDAVARRFFRQSAPQQWSLEVAGERP